MDSNQPYAIWQVEVPPNVRAGDKFRVTAPDGQRFDLTCPAGATPGMIIDIKMRNARWVASFTGGQKVANPNTIGRSDWLEFGERDNQVHRGLRVQQTGLRNLLKDDARAAVQQYVSLPAASRAREQR